MGVSELSEYGFRLEDLLEIRASSQQIPFGESPGLDFGDVVAYIPFSSDEEPSDPESTGDLLGFSFKKRFAGDDIPRFLPKVVVALRYKRMQVEAYVGLSLSGDPTFAGGLPPIGSLVVVGFFHGKDFPYVLGGLPTRYTSRVSRGFYPELKPGEMLYQAGVHYSQQTKLLQFPRYFFDKAVSDFQVLFPGARTYADWKGRMIITSREGDSGIAPVPDGQEGSVARKIQFDKDKDASVEITLGNPVMDTPVLKTKPTGNGPFKGDTLILGTEADDVELLKDFFDGAGSPHKILKGLSIRPRIFSTHTGKSACNHFGTNEKDFVELDVAPVESSVVAPAGPIPIANPSPAPDSITFDDEIKESMKAKPIALRIKARNATVDIDTDGNVTHDSLKDLAESAVNRYMESSGWHRMFSKELMELISQDGIILKGKNGVRLSDDAGNLIQVSSKGITIMSKGKHTLTMDDTGVKVDGNFINLENGDAAVNPTRLPADTVGIAQTLVDFSATWGVGVGATAMNPVLLAKLIALLTVPGSGLRTNRPKVDCT